jgi:hypothetical protein
MASLKLVFSGQGYRILKRLSREQGVSKLEIIRRALAIWFYLHEQGVRIGGPYNLQIRDKATNEVEKQIIF